MDERSNSHLERQLAMIATSVLGSAQWVDSKDQDQGLLDLGQMAGILAVAAINRFGCDSALAYSIFAREAGMEALRVMGASVPADKVLKNPLNTLSVSQKKKVISGVLSLGATPSDREAVIDAFILELKAKKELAPVSAYDRWEIEAKKEALILSRARAQKTESKEEFAARSARGLSAQDRSELHARMESQTRSGKFMAQALEVELDSARDMLDRAGDAAKTRPGFYLAPVVARESALALRLCVLINAPESAELALRAARFLSDKAYPEDAPLSTEEAKLAGKQIENAALSLIGSLEMDANASPVAQTTLALLLKSRIFPSERLYATRGAWALIEVGQGGSAEQREAFEIKAGFRLGQEWASAEPRWRCPDDAARDALSQMLEGLTGASRGIDAHRLANALMDAQSVEADTSGEASERSARLRQSCVEGLAFLGQRFTEIGRIAQWKEINEELTRSGAGSWAVAINLDSKIELARRGPVDELVDELCEGSSPGSPALAARVMGALAQQKSHLRARFESEELTGVTGVSRGSATAIKSRL